MPDGRRPAGSRADLCAIFSAAFAWVGLAPYLLFYVASSLPVLAHAYFLVWTAGLLSDFYTTYRFYRADPENFERNELSGYMRRLYRLFGFKVGLVAFLAFVEVPIGLIVSLVLVPTSASFFAIFFRCPRPEVLTCLSSGFAFLGLSHLVAAAWNLASEEGPIHRVGF
ncbi:MAG: hypothetical protein FGF50_09220 [Candidatus Brockarchaeota archaeon]|nr:hypothetical protein [Candidatus Brockarchaeota archaeon]